MENNQETPRNNTLSEVVGASSSVHGEVIPGLTLQITEREWVQWSYGPDSFTWTEPAVKYLPTTKSRIPFKLHDREDSTLEKKVIRARFRSWGFRTFNEDNWHSDEWEIVPDAKNAEDVVAFARAKFEADMHPENRRYLLSSLSKVVVFPDAPPRPEFGSVEEAHEHLRSTYQNSNPGNFRFAFRTDLPGDLDAFDAAKDPDYFNHDEEAIVEGRLAMIGCDYLNKTRAQYAAENADYGKALQHLNSLKDLQK